MCALLATAWGCRWWAVGALVAFLLLPLTASADGDSSLATLPGQYGPWDAALILLREGLEAILVITALLAFLNKSGNGAKSGWVWAGGGAGILASVIVGVAIQASFARAVSDSGREWVEGLTGLLAAVMLVYMSWWLHGKASLAAWHAYIRQHTSRALATGSLLSLAALAFLAVFREGAETMLFFVGVAPGITLPNLLLGLAAGGAALLAIAIAILVFGLRLPLRPFFFGASLLVYYLAFKFLGTGLHALQEAGAVPITPTPHLPAIDWLGVFPSWQTSVPQLLLLLLAALVILWPRVRPMARLANGH